MLTYKDRARLCNNPSARKLFQLMDSKSSNLALSVDVTRKKELLHFADLLGPEICVLKTHIDIVEDFDSGLIKDLVTLSEKHQFIIFEDRKFADIGHTVKMQYEKGIYHIANWASLVNAFVIPGPGIIQALEEVGLSKGNGLLLIAELSSKDNLARGEYTQAAINMAQANKDFVTGFITQHRLIDDPSFINLTPGIHLAQTNDPLGQQYVTPEQAIIERNTDVIIVGRGIIEAEDPKHAAQEYRQAGWQAYLKRLKI